MIFKDEISLINHIFIKSLKPNIYKENIAYSKISNKCYFKNFTHKPISFSHIILIDLPNIFIIKI